MKKRMSILVKALHLFYVLLVIIIFQSCGTRTPIIDGRVPFVVGEIVKYNETHSKYYAIDDNSGDYYNSLKGSPMIILPSKMYQIDDTIKSGFNNH